MIRTSPAKLLLTACAAAAAVLVTHRPETRPRQPPRRIVVILIDTLRADHLPFYGYAKNTAPFLSRLASESVVFDRAYSTSAWTAPATASLFSGVYPFQHNVVTGFAVTQQMRTTGAEVELDRLPEEIETIAEALKRGGYDTYAVTGNLNVRAEMGFSQGFDRFWSSGSGKPSAEELNAKLKQWAPRIEKSPRYLLYAHYMDPHRPYRARDPWFDAADPAGRDIAAYDSEIAYLDSQLEELFQLFKWQGDDTLVVVVADHGEGFGEHGSWGHSRTLFSEIVDIPLIVRPPGGSKAIRVAEPVSLIDVLPTLRDFAGLPPDPRCEGRSLRGLITGEGGGPGPRQLLCHLVRKDRGGRTTRATIHDGWKWIGERPGGSSLFNLVSDPSEQGNLIRRYLPIADSLEREFMAFETTSRKFSSGTLRQALSPERLEDLKALGYVQ